MLCWYVVCLLWRFADDATFERSVPNVHEIEPAVLLVVGRFLRLPSDNACRKCPDS